MFVDAATRNTLYVDILNQVLADDSLVPEDRKSVFEAMREIEVQMKKGV